MSAVIIIGRICMVIFAMSLIPTCLTLKNGSLGRLGILSIYTTAISVVGIYAIGTWLLIAGLV